MNTGRRGVLKALGGLALAPVAAAVASAFPVADTATFDVVGWKVLLKPAALHEDWFAICHPDVMDDIMRMPPPSPKQEWNAAYAYIRSVGKRDIDPRMVLKQYEEEYSPAVYPAEFGQIDGVRFIKG